MFMEWERHPLVTNPQLSDNAKKVFEFLLTQHSRDGKPFRSPWHAEGGYAGPAHKLVGGDKHQWFKILEELRFAGLLRFDDREGGSGWNSAHVRIQPVPAEPEDRAPRYRHEAFQFAELLEYIPVGFRPKDDNEALRTENLIRQRVALLSGKSIKGGFWWKEGAKVLLAECVKKKVLSPFPALIDSSVDEDRFIRDYENATGFSELLHLGRQLKIVRDDYRVYVPNVHHDGPTYFADRVNKYVEAVEALRKYLRDKCGRVDADTMTWPEAIAELKRKQARSLAGTGNVKGIQFGSLKFESAEAIEKFQIQMLLNSENAPGRNEALYWAQKLKLIPAPDFRNPAVTKGRGYQYYAERDRKLHATDHAVRSYVCFDCERKDAFKMSWLDVTEILKARAKADATPALEHPISPSKVVGIRTNSVQPPESKAKRRWTQKEVDGAIRKYRSDRATQFNGHQKAIEAAKSEAAIRRAVGEARKHFGRNTIAMNLGCPQASVSNSPAWKSIAAELQLSGRTPGTGRGERVGLEVAADSYSEAAHRRKLNESDGLTDAEKAAELSALIAEQEADEKADKRTARRKLA